MIFRSAKYVVSGDGAHRVRLIWGFRAYHAFVTTEEIRDTVRELLLLLKEEENWFAKQPGKTRTTPTGKSSGNPIDKARGNAKSNSRSAKERR